MPFISAAHIHNITTSEQGFGSITHGVNQHFQRIGWTSGANSEDRKMQIGYGIAAFGSSGFSSQWNYHYRSILTLDLAIENVAENEHFGFLGVNTENPLAPVHIVFDPHDINETEAGKDCGLLIETTGWYTHDYALRINSGRGDVFRFSNAGELFIGRDLSGSNPGGFKLYVEDGIRTEKVRVDIAASNGWADFVFEDNYELMSIEELEAYIQMHKHLPNVPSEAEVAEDGMDLAEMNAILLRQIEELTLRVIEMQKELNQMKSSK